MSDCARETIDSSVVGMSVAREVCPGELPSGDVGNFAFGVAATDADVVQFESNYNPCEHELRVTLGFSSTAAASQKLRVRRTRGGLTNAGFKEFAGGNKNWKVIEDATAVARWDRVSSFTETQTVVALIDLEGLVEDGDVFTIEVSDDDFVTVLAQTLTVTVDGTGLVVWKEVPLTDDSDTGSEKTLQERNTRTKSRQRQRAGIIDSESSVGFEVEVTNSTFDDFIEAFTYARKRSQVSTVDGSVEVTAIGANSITVDDSTKLPVGSLIKLWGLVNSNGVKLVTATPDAVTLTADVVAEADLSNLVLRKVGVQATAGDINIDVTGAVVTLTSTVLDFTTLDINVGQWGWVGGQEASTRFDQGYGAFRIHKIEANVLTIRQVRWKGVATEVAAGKTIQLRFGDFTRNEDDTTLVKRWSHQFEQILGEDKVGIQSRYFLGQAANEMSIDMSAAESLTATFGFIGLETENRDGSVGLKEGVRLSAPKEDSLNSTDHIREMFIYMNDDSRLTPEEIIGAVETAEITINNEAAYAKKIGKKGAFAINIGNFLVDLSAKAYFTTVAALEAIDNAADVGFNVMTTFNNEAMLFDIPSITMSGDIDTSDTSVKIDLENAAAENEYGYTLSFSRFYDLPDLANPGQ